MKKTKNVIIVFTTTVGALHHTGTHPGSMATEKKLVPKKKIKKTSAAKKKK